MLFLGIFLLWTTWSLYKTVESQQIEQHPIFRPDCYNPNRTTSLSQVAPPTRGSMNRSRSPQKQRPSNSDNKDDVERGNAPRTSNNKKLIKMKPGVVMRLQGITARPELNGSKVKLLKRPEGTEGRWEIELLDGGSKMSVTESKLVPL